METNMLDNAGWDKNKLENIWEGLFKDSAIEIKKADGTVKDIAPKRIIYKYNIEKNNVIEENIESVLDVQIQNDTLVAWILINPIYPKRKIKIDAIGTGWPYSDRRSKYLRTLQDGELVWHIFVRDNPSTGD